MEIFLEDKKTEREKKNKAIMLTDFQFFYYYRSLGKTSLAMIVTPFMNRFDDTYGEVSFDFFWILSPFLSYVDHFLIEMTLNKIEFY